MSGARLLGLGLVVASLAACKAEAQTQAPMVEVERQAPVLFVDDEYGRDKSVNDYRHFIAAHEGDPEWALEVIDAHLGLGKLYRESNSRAAAEEQFGRVIELFAEHGFESGTVEAARPAEAQFLLAEYAFEDAAKLQISATDSEGIAAESQAIFTALVDVAAAYDAVFPYRSLEWVLAAMFQRGFAFEQCADTILGAPIPTALDSDAARDAYVEIVEDQMAPLYDKAVALYEEIVARSEQFDVSTEWTQRARERLRVYKPNEYPRSDATLALEQEERR